MAEPVAPSQLWGPEGDSGGQSKVGVEHIGG